MEEVNPCALANMPSDKHTRGFRRSKCEMREAEERDTKVWLSSLCYNVLKLFTGHARVTRDWFHTRRHVPARVYNEKRKLSRKNKCETECDHTYPRLRSCCNNEPSFGSPVKKHAAYFFLVMDAKKREKQKGQYIYSALYI